MRVFLFAFIFSSCVCTFAQDDAANITDAAATTSQPDNLAIIGGDTSNTVQPDFVGIASPHNPGGWNFGYKDASLYKAPNYPLFNLLKALQNGAPMFVRIGGGSSDDSSLDVLDGYFRSSLQALSQNVNTTIAFGVNFAANDPNLAASEASYYAQGTPAIKYFEPGNESNWYGAHGVRPWDFSTGWWIWEYNNKQVAPIQAAVPGAKFFGPSWDNPAAMVGPRWGNIFDTLPAPYLQLESGIDTSQMPVVNVHYYAGYDPGNEPGDYLLSPAAVNSTSLSQLSQVIPTFHSHGQKFRIGEFNSIDGGGQPGVSDTFQSALWIVDQMFAFANVGVDGVNVNGVGSDNYEMADFTNGSYDPSCPCDPYQASVRPMYYGMLFFANATSNVKAIRQVSTYSFNSNISVWAVDVNDGSTRVVIIDKDAGFNGDVAIQIPGFSGNAAVDTLTAGSYWSQSGITYDGQTFDGTSNGILTGSKQVDTLGQSNGYYYVNFTTPSIKMLTVRN